MSFFLPHYLWWSLGSSSHLTRSQTAISNQIIYLGVWLSKINSPHIWWFNHEMCIYFVGAMYYYCNVVFIMRKFFVINLHSCVSCALCGCLHSSAVQHLIRIITNIIKWFSCNSNFRTQVSQVLQFYSLLFIKKTGDFHCTVNPRLNNCIKSSPLKYVVFLGFLLHVWLTIESLVSYLRSLVWHRLV